jgi:hypothetical protein
VYLAVITKNVTHWYGDKINSRYHTNYGTECWLGPNRDVNFGSLCVHLQKEIITNHDNAHPHTYLDIIIMIMIIILSTERIIPFRNIFVTSGISCQKDISKKKNKWWD